MKVQTRHIASGTAISTINAEEVFGYSVYEILTGFTFQKLFGSFWGELGHRAFDEKEFLAVIEQSKSLLPTIPDTAFFLVVVNEKFQVYRNYLRQSGESEIIKYNFDEEKSNWAALNCKVFIRT